MKIPLSWLKDYVDTELSPQELAEKLTMAGLEVTAIEEKAPRPRSGQAGEKIFEIEVTSNRPDLLSIVGVAREAAAVTGKRLKIPNPKSQTPNKSQIPNPKFHLVPSTARRNALGARQKQLKIKIEDKKACLRYVGTVIEGVKVTSSPKWITERLEAVGVRPVNNVVDITNYVLFELGQPLHAFDYDKLQGEKIIVRRAEKDEELTTIDKATSAKPPHSIINCFA